ncbi:unnamed protein product [Rotaria magnacalcarata]|uniref:Uncharacterized protein n=1 Tax=Rotaria magnacalcarata TaxID=392030 RepID=A0A816U3Y9_9BILA|nr:unnamed protein product [Rotaria magnacalcarata]
MRAYNVNISTMIQRGTIQDTTAILQLYKNVINVYPDQMTQRVDELTLGSVKSALWQATLRGTVLVMFQNENLIGFFKTYTNEFCRHAHVHSNLTIMIDPTNVGTKL